MAPQFGPGPNEVYSLHIRISRSGRNVALNGHQPRRVHKDNGLATQLPYGPLTHEELLRPQRPNPDP